MAYEILMALGRQIGDHLWQSTLFAAAIGIVTLIVKTNHACVRYRLWMVASLKFLVPFSLLSSIGWRLGSRFAPSGSAVRISSIVDEVSTSLAPLGHVGSTQSPASTHLATYAVALLFAVWGLGCAFVLVLSGRRWWRTRAVVRRAVPLRTGGMTTLWNHPAVQALRIQIVSSQAALEPGVFGIFRPVLYFPARIAEHLSEPELMAILTHELCHVRRRDNLTAAMHVLVETLFWFHPLVWWLGARLIEERERACDEGVLESGIEPRVYAQGILQVCNQCLKSPVPWVAGATGSSLRKRIEEIMTQREISGLSSSRKIFLSSAALLAVICPVIAGIVGGARLHAQPTTPIITAAPSGPKFEVASIKPASLTTGPPPNYGIRIDAARVDIGSWALKQLILRAYGLPAYQLSGPDWINTERFDIVAKFPAGATSDQFPEMMQGLLAERFGLVAHTETRNLPGFALVQGKGGLKVKLAEPRTDVAAQPTPASPLERAGRTLDRLWSNDPSDFGATTTRSAVNVLHTEFKRIPMEALAQIAADRLGAPVVDGTGLRGDYQLALDLVIPGAVAPESVGELSPPDPAGAMRAAIERLGLKLELRKTSIQVLVVDTLRRVPTDN